MKRKLLRITLVLFAAALVCRYVYYKAFVAAPMSRNLQINMQAHNSLRAVAFTTVVSGYYPEDVLSETGEPILSWRAALSENDRDDGYFGDVPDVDLTKAWDDPANLDAASRRPSEFFYPYYLEEYDPGKTCLFRINDVHERLVAGVATPGDCPYLVLAAPQHAVPWTKPQDVSIQEITDKKVRLFYAGNYFYQYYRKDMRRKLDRSRDEKDGVVYYADVSGAVWTREFDDFVELLKSVDVSTEVEKGE
ncbi:MAG: hypothetical protein IJM54_01605 [Thermoguttaceae bacterium]|nr:hypothetical protein [Thermoguttaceae bacterium]